LNTIGSAAQRLGCSYAVLWRKIAAGRIKASKHGLQWFIEDDELERLLIQNSDKLKVSQHEQR